MQVILLERIGNLGNLGDEVAVKNGYGRNFLIPQGKAYEATKGNLRHIESLKQARAIREANELEAATKLANRLNKQRLKFELATGQGGKAFGSITVKDIQEELANTDRQFRDIDRKQIALGKPIKSTGEFEVDVKLHPEVTATLKLRVNAKVEEPAEDDEESAEGAND